MEMLNQVSILIGHNDLCSKSCLSPFQRLGLSRWLFYRLYFVEELYYIRNLSRWLWGSSTIMSWIWSWCWQPSRRVAVEPRDYERNLRKTLKILSTSLPKTFVVLLAPIQVRDALQNHHIFAHNDFMIKLWMMTTPLTRSASPWIWWTRANFARSSPTLMSVLASLDQDLALLAGDRVCHVDEDDYNSLWNWWYI